MTVTNSSDTLAAGARPDAVALDVYSQTVSTVARVVMPSVVSLVLDSARANRRAGGAGSGVVITPDGYLLTSAHVVARGRTGTASFADGRELRFTVTGSDPLSDLA